MKVLIVHNSYRNRGGEDSVVAAEAQMLSAAGIHVIKYFRSNQEIGTQSLLEKARLGLNTLWSIESYRELKELIRRERPQVAHFHNTFPLISPGAYAACTDLGIPVVQTIHNYRLLCPGGTLFRDGWTCEECVGTRAALPGVVHACYRGSRAMTSAVAATNLLHRELETWNESVNLYIAPSRFTRQKLIEGGLPAKKIVVKPHFVSPDPGPRATPGEYAIYAGRLSEEKGLRTLLRAWKLSGANITLRIVGNGPLRSELETECERLELQDVHFVGELEHSETIEVIKAAHFLLMPSECYEAYPMTVAEAAACAVAVIATRHGALAEVVQHNETGLLFNPFDVHDLGAMIDWACCHPEAIAEMGRAAREKYEAELTAEQNLPQLLSIYERAGASCELRAPAKRAEKLTEDASAAPTAACPSFSVLGVPVNATQIPEVVRQMNQWTGERGPCRMIAVTGMHGVIEAQHDADFRGVLTSADMVVPDGIPLVWLGRLRGFALRRRVYGPELMLTFCERAAGNGLRHFLYGGEPGQADKLAAILQERFPGLLIVGTYSPPFRPLTAEEDAQVSTMINEAAPDVVWIGLGTPKQERWMHEHRTKLRVPVLVGVGAAFDIHTGTKSQAPVWMREHGLEWLFRLMQEPRRLWKRYLIYGSEFVVRVGLELMGVGKNAHVR